VIRTERTEALAAVHDAVADRVHVAHGAEGLDAGLGRDEPAQQVVDRGGVIAQRHLLADAGLSRGVQRDERERADALDAAVGVADVLVPLHALRVGLDQLESQAR
jgi:hypothetical protein